MNEPTTRTPIERLTKLWEFFRSVLPVDPGQTALLFGSVLLLAVPHMHTWSSWIFQLKKVEGLPAVLYVSTALVLPLYLVYFGGAIALWVALNEVHDPSRWLHGGARTLVVAGLTIDLALGWYFQNHYSNLPLVPGRSVLQNSLVPEFMARWPGFAFEVALFGWLLVLIADGRLQNAKMALPVQFPGKPGDFAGAATQTATLIWCTLAMTSLVGLVADGFSTLLAVETGMGSKSSTPVWLSTVEWQIPWAIGLAIIIWISCGDGKFALFSRSLRLPQWRWIVLAVVFPLAALSATTLGGFYLYRIRGPAAYPANYPAEFSHHFPVFKWAYLIYIVPALAEEIAWRGYLQPNFIRRFGLYRGIFLVGIVWGAFHFPWDFTGRTNAVRFAIAITERLTNCVLWGFVLSWLTLKARSVIPSAIAHGVANALLQVGSEGATPSWIIFGMWGALAFLLFRFWPPEVEDESVAAAPPDDELQGSSGVVESPA